MKKPDTITISVVAQRKLYASSVDMYVVIEGSSLISDKSALKKAKEVRTLVEALKVEGISEDKIQIIGISASVSTGIISKTSSAKYRLKIEIPETDMLARVLGVVSSRKNSEMMGLDWKYGDHNDVHESLLEEAITHANRRAHLACEKLSHLNIGVHSLLEEFHDDETKQYRSHLYDLEDSATIRRARSNASMEDTLGLDVIHSKVVKLKVKIEYNVKPK